MWLRFRTRVLLTTVLAAAPALGADGVLEINQACAVGPGCFAGDAPGLPVEISGAAGRSYRLTSDLVAATVSTPGIVFSGSLSGFTVDLGGFTIRGPVTCSGTPNVCSGVGSGAGISRAIGSTATGIVVRNGSVIGMGRGGIELFPVDDCVVEDVIARENATTGVSAGPGSRVHRVTAVRNGSDGILVGASSIVSASVSSQNDGRGVVVGGGNLLASGNTVFDNRSIGISASDGCNVARNAVTANGGDGIHPASGSLVIENTIVGNGDGSAGDGAACVNGCRAHGNTVRANIDTGLSFNLDGAYSDNNITANTLLPVSGGATPRGGNFCDGTGVVAPACP